MPSRVARRSLAGLSLVVLVGMLAGCAENRAEDLADTYARTSVRLLANRLQGHLVPAAEYVYVTAVVTPDMTIDAMRASGSSLDGEIVLRIHVTTQGGGFGGEDVTTRCYRYPLTELTAGLPQRVDCPTTPPLPVPSTDRYYRLPAHARQRLAGALTTLSRTERRSPGSVRAALAGAFRERTLLRGVASAPDGTIGISVSTPDVHAPSLGLACVLARIGPRGTFQTWSAAIVTHDPAIDCSAERVADGRLPAPRS